METKKSIFKLQKRRFVYEVQKHRGQDTVDFSGYRAGSIVERVCKFTQVVSEEILGEYEFEMPILGAGSKFYLSDIDRTVRVEEAIRSSDNRILYIVADSTVEDEVSLKSKEDAKKLLELNRSNIYNLENLERENVGLRNKLDTLVFHSERDRAKLDESREKYFKLKNNWFVKTFIDRE